MYEALPTPPVIAEFPELAVLGVLDYTLDGCMRALVAAHPELDGSELPYLPGYTAQYALHVVREIWRLRRDLERYRFCLWQGSAHRASNDADTAL